MGIKAIPLAVEERNQTSIPIPVKDSDVSDNHVHVNHDFDYV